MDSEESETLSCKEFAEELALVLAIIVIGGILALFWMLSNSERQNYE